MEAERAKGLAEIQKHIDKTRTDIDKKVKDGQAKVEAEAAKELPKLQQKIDEQLKAAQAKAKAAEDKLATASDANIAALEKQTADAIKKIDQVSVDTQKKLASVVSAADAKATAEANKQVKAIAADGKKAFKAIDTFVKEAEKQVEAQGTAAGRKLDVTSGEALDAVQKASKDAKSSNAAQTEKALNETKAQGQAAQTELSTTASVGIDAMAIKNNAIDGDIKKQWITDAVADSKDKLGSWFSDDDDAISAMNTLSSLPADAQEEALKQLGDESFKDLLAGLPEKRGVDLQNLASHTKDPALKVQLWGEIHKSKVSNDIKAINDKEGLPTPADALTEEGRKKIHAFEIRKKQLDETRLEADDEVKELLKQISTGPKDAAGNSLDADGKIIDANTVDAIATRKEKEYAVEKKYGVNLTNDRDQAGTPGAPTLRPITRKTWSDKELDEVDKTLGKLPEDHVKGNTHLEEFKRCATLMEWDTAKGAWVDNSPNGQHSGGSIQMFGKGDLTKKSGRTTGTNVIQSTLTHEIGHDVEEANKGDAFEHFKATAEWKSLTPVDLATNMAKDGKSFMEIMQAMKDLEATRQSHYTGQNQPKAGDSTYMVDPYDPNNANYLSHNSGAIPETKLSGEWKYAGSNASDHFAETYTKMVNVPKLAHGDLIDEPLKKLGEKSADAAEKAKKIEELTKTGVLPSDPRMITALADQKKAADAVTEQADNAKRMEDQWNIMRNEVFHTDKATTAANDSLAKVPTPPGQDKAKADILKQFEADAKLCATPTQLAELRQQAEDDISHL
jgi:hypothetical protein